MTERETWLGPAELSASLGISRRTIYNWLMAGKLRYERTVGGTVRIDPDSVWIVDDGPRTPWIVDREIHVAKVKSGRRGGKSRRFRAA